MRWYLNMARVYVGMWLTLIFLEDSRDQLKLTLLIFLSNHKYNYISINHTFRPTQCIYYLLNHLFLYESLIIIRCFSSWPNSDIHNNIQPFSLLHIILIFTLTWSCDSCVSQKTLQIVTGTFIDKAIYK